MLAAPVSFQDIVGHRRLLSLLSRSIARGTLPPSLIFSGPDGVGKRRAALATAQALNCLQPLPGDATLEADACGVCSACQRIARLMHPDVRLVEPGDTGSIKIEQVREVVEAAGYRPFEGRRRVVVIEAAEALVGPAQNALLKTLEEPGAASVFILVSSSADSLLPTVRSRCSRLRFGRLTADEVASVLVAEHDYAGEDARTAAALAGGSVGRALQLRTGDYVQARHVALGLLGEMAGTIDVNRDGNAAAGLARPQWRPTEVRARLEAAQALVATAKASKAPGKRSGRRSKKKSEPGGGSGPRTDRERVGVSLDVLASLLRDVSVLATGANPAWLANLDLESDLTTLAGRFDSHRAVRAFTAVDRAHDALDRNVGPKVVADWLSLHL